MKEVWTKLLHLVDKNLSIVKGIEAFGSVFNLNVLEYNVKIIWISNISICKNIKYSFATS